MSRFLFFGTIILILIVVEVYVFYGLRTTFKPGLGQTIAKSFYFFGIGITVVTIAGAFLSMRAGLSTPGWIQNLCMGLMVTMFMTKLSFALFLLGEDVYRVGRYAAEHVAAWFKTEAEPVSFESRRRFIGQAGVILAGIPFASFLYGITGGKYNYTLHKVNLRYPDLPEAFDGLRIVQISDIHAGSFDSFEGVSRGVRMVQAQNPDIILFTGDFVNNLAEEVVPYMELFEKLTAPLGKFSIMGNHDYGEYMRWAKPEDKAANIRQLKAYQAQMGFRLLDNENLRIEKDGQAIRLAGVENWGAPPFKQYGDLAAAMAGVQDNDFTILMSHDPTHWDGQIRKFPKKVHLTLSGHTHGAQMGVELPFFRFSPVQFRYDQWAGHYEDDLGQSLYVNRGFGYIGFPGRVGIWPEVTLIELQRG